MCANADCSTTTQSAKYCRSLQRLPSDFRQSIKECLSIHCIKVSIGIKASYLFGRHIHAFLHDFSCDLFTNTSCIGQCRMLQNCSHRRRGKCGIHGLCPILCHQGTKQRLGGGAKHLYANHFYKRVDSPCSSRQPTCSSRINLSHIHVTVRRPCFDIKSGLCCCTKR